MTEIPTWFGLQEFNLIIGTIWFYLIAWIVVSIVRVNGTKLDIKRKIVGFKHWNY